MNSFADSSYWVYQYDSLGQVTSGKKYFSDGTPVPGQQFEYGFDDIGNRTSTKAGGDSLGSSASLRSATYAANTLNQYTSRAVPNAFDVLGASHATNSVTINGSAADYRRGEYFQELVGVVNNATSVWKAVNVTNSGGGWTTGNVFVAKTPEAFYYDKDGNLTNDGRWVLTWDAENRLVQMESRTDVPTSAKLKLLFGYDAQGRRISKTVSNWVSGAWQLQSTNRFVYDGWNLLAALNSSSAVVQSFVWGLDLSGSMQGAGGVGGLLAVNDTANGTHFCAYDGNGNLAALIKASDGTISGNWEYGPFGEVLRQSGLMAKANPFRFSTKYQDDESDNLYYGYRSYNPSTGRWLSRDSMRELLEPNLFAFVKNNPINNFDWNGMLTISVLESESVECESTRVSFRFTLARPISWKGYMVLENQRYTKVNVGCEEWDCPKTGSAHGSKFWEAFPVDAGSSENRLQKLFGSSEQALFALQKSLKPSCGYAVIVGILRFFSSSTTGDLGDWPNDNQKLPEGWIDPSKDPVPAPLLRHPTIVPYTLKEPKWWRSSIDGPELRTATTSWECGCCGGYWNFDHRP